MNRKEKPQISPDRLKPLLEFDNLDKGIKIHKALDQTTSHWQLRTLILKGIDAKKECLLCETLDGIPEAVPFHELREYYINMNHVDSKHDYKKTTKPKKSYADLS